MGRFAAFILIGVTLAFAPVPAWAQELVPLKLYYSSTRTDNISTANTQLGEQAVDEGFRFVRISACLFRDRQGTTVPLQTRYSPERRNHVTLASEAARTRVSREGFRPLNEAGHVYRSERPDTVPLILFWNGDRQDYFLAVTDQEIRDAELANYERISIEGYALPASACTGTSAAITDAQYTIIFDTIECRGECNLGRVRFGTGATPNLADLRRSEAFEMREDRVYLINHGFRFEAAGGGVFWQIDFVDRSSGGTVLTNPIALHRDGRVTLNGPQTRTFATRLPRRRNETTIEVSYRLFRASP